VILKKPTAAGFTLTLSVLVSLAWVVNFVAPWVLSSYRPDPSVNNLMMLVVGGAVTLAVERANAGRRHGEMPKEGPSQ
jgi:hypothetical protein